MTDYEKLGKSVFQISCMHDCVDYSNLFKLYLDLEADNSNIKLANKIATQALILASRWSEIGSYSKQMCEKYGFGVTDYRMWAHEKYSTLKELHVHARMIWKDAKDELRETLKYGGQT